MTTNIWPLTEEWRGLGMQLSVVSSKFQSHEILRGLAKAGCEALLLKIVGPKMESTISSWWNFKISVVRIYSFQWPHNVHQQINVVWMSFQSLLKTKSHY